MLNEMQKKAVESSSDKILVIAGAGSGKTHLLIERLAKLVNDDGVDPTNILVLTFTNAAAREMTERYQKRCGGKKTPKFGTFHAFCYSLIVKDVDIRRALRYSAPPSLASPEDIKRIKSTAKVICGTKLSDAKLENSSRLKANEKFEYDVFWKQYDKLLRQENLITFDIMCGEVSGLFIDDDPLTHKYKEQYKYVFQDEAQDSAPMNMDFVFSFYNSKLFAVGDFRQALYSFRGADSSIIKGLADNPEWETIVLSQNYRSTKQIVDYANSIHNYGASALNIDMKSDKDGEPIHFKPDFDYEKADDLLSIAADKTDKNTVAVLCRTNAEVADIREMMTQYGIPYITDSKNKTTIELLRCSIDSEYCVKYLADNLSNTEYMRYLKTIASEELSEEQFINLFGKNFPYMLPKIMKLRSILSKNDTVPAIFLELIKYLKIKVDVSIGLDCANVVELVYTLIDKLDTQCESGIYVGTIHSSKGLEYDVVHVIGVNGKSFPVNKNEDQQNCYYVACTRAKSKLVIWGNPDVDNDYVSRFRERESTDIFGNRLDNTTKMTELIYKTQEE